jgi:hypothetical protein
VTQLFHPYGVDIIYIEHAMHIRAAYVVVFQCKSCQATPQSALQVFQTLGFRFALGPHELK